MNAPASKSSGYSAHVRMELRVNGHVLRIAQMSSDFLMLKQPVAHPPADAEIYLRIDDSESRWRVRLVEGISTTEAETRIAPLP